MKLSKIVTVMAFASMVAGCVTTPPVIMENAFQRKVITPCDNDIFCLRSSYSVTWDYTRSSCSSAYYRDGCVQLPSYPVSYKNSEYIVETGSDGYRITMPSGGTVKMFE